MEKSWNFEIRAKSHGKVMEFDKKFCILMKRGRYATGFQNPSGVYVDEEVMDFCDSVMEKSWKSHGILSQKFRGNPAVSLCTLNV